jgi:N-acetylneuraminic acid mutarotase
VIQSCVTALTSWFTTVAFAEPIARIFFQSAAVAIMLTPLPAYRICLATPPSIDAKRLADLPNAMGVAGPFVGIAGKALIVAGGTNFPDAPPWNNGTKTWYDTAFVLQSPDATWLDGFKLPRPLAYGVSITTDAGLLCIGGCDQTHNVADVFLVQWDGKALTNRPFPPLPTPTSCAAGALIGSRVYVAGGQAGPEPNAGRSQSHFWMLDLDQEPSNWKTLPTWPGPERFYAIAGTDGNSFFLFSGIRPILDKRNQPSLEYLTDAYCFDPTAERWTRLADLPHANAAVASPAPFVDGGMLLLGRGADGTGIDLPLKDRPPFGREILRYDLSTGTWKTLGPLPFGLAAVPSTQWNGKSVIASGERQPGVRSPAVWSIDLTSAVTDAQHTSPRSAENSSVHGID